MVGYVRLVWKLLGKVGECVNAPPNTTQVTLKAEVKTTLPVQLVVQVIVEQLRLRNDLYCVGWGVKLYSLTHS